MEENLKELKTIVTKLVTEHHVKHKTIKKEIFKTLQELSNNLPPLKVLYNDVHGGFDYSDQFKDYLHENNIAMDDLDYSTDARIFFVPYVEQFGKQCKERYPLVTTLISTYNKYKLGSAFNILYSIQVADEELDRISQAKELILETETVLFGNESNFSDYHISLYNFNIEKVLKYDKTSLLNWIDTKQKTQNQKKDSSIEKLHQLLDDHHATLILQNKQIKFDEELEESIPWYKQKKWNESATQKRLWFLESVKHYRENHFAIWKCQDYYKDTAMRFLLKHHKFFPIENTDFCTDLEMGLLCASGPYCRLQVGDAPQVLAWYIGEYDGKEGIVVKP